MLSESEMFEIHALILSCLECIALFQYAGPAGDLTFNEGDVIQITKQEGEWWEGYCNGQHGMFPANYVKLKEPEVGLRVLKKKYYCD